MELKLRKDFGAGLSPLKKCPVCGKLFPLPPENVYKLSINDRVTHFCSYSCFRVEQKKQEEKHKKKKSEEY